MAFDPSEYYGDEKILLKIEGEYQGKAVTAYCSPDAKGRTFMLGGDVDLETTVTDTMGAPFPIDVILHDDEYPLEGNMQDIRDELGTEFEARFQQKTENVFNQIEDAEDPIDAIKELDPADL